MQMSSFRQAGDCFTGRLQTLGIDVPLRIVPVALKNSDRAPDWRIHLYDEPDGHTVGSGWTRERDGRPPFISVEIDCPSLVRPLRASVHRSANDRERFVLLWARPKAD